MITIGWLAREFKDLTSLTALGEGGQKWVFSASHASDGNVVLKLIKPGQDVERVRREVLAVQQAASSRVPKIMDIGTLDTPAGNCLWLREQRVVGESVREMLKQGPIPVGEVTTLARQMLEALADLERARIVHRDVKPDNIMRDMSGAYWLLDFGIARHLDLQSLTLTAALAGPGTLGYAPPEQYRNKKREVDGRADLFALGVTMVECLTGKHPFREGARDVGEVIRRIEGTAVAVPQIRGDAGGKIADFIRAMVQRRLDCRPATAQDAGDWLNEACGLPKA